MNRNYLINKIEDLSRRKGLDINYIYNECARRYCRIYGNNIKYEMEEIYHEYDMPSFLEKRGFIDRYVSIVNEIEK